MIVFYMENLDNIGVKIGENMRARRKALGMSLQAVGDLAGTSKAHIWDLEKGNSVNPSITMLVRICAALRTNLNDILGFDVAQPILTEQELELIAAHRRIFGKPPRADADIRLPRQERES